MSITGLISIALSAILIENFILVKFLGICPFLGVSKKMDTAVGMGLAVIFVMGLASLFTWLVNHFLLVPLHLEYMQTLAYILVIASLVQFVEMFLQKSIPTLYRALGIYLPLITTNCAVLGVAVLNTTKGYNLLESVVYGVSGGIGFLVAIVLFASIRERIQFSEHPKAFEGFPIALVSSALLAMAFMGFSGLKIW
ncbi:MAG: electron transport complex subunit RsxA [Oscillospiraceae bacterium]|nr:electron transport complex subunit RsxA [Oscillospiraceae bacterium]